MTKPVIAIDGPAASGKGTLARRIAAALNYAHMDTGLLYRAVGFLTVQEGGDAGDAPAALRAAQALAASDLKILENPDLRSDACSELASKAAAIPAVREALLALQKRFASQPPPPFEGAVLDGRDIGTVICPDAAAKLFVTASPEARAERRLKELQSRGVSATYDAVLRAMRERDARDAERSSAPMKAAGDAATIDTTALDADAAFAKAMTIVRDKLDRA